ncbi:MAG TPA: PEP-CTERM sorting domain-containing protein, partial [Methylotenera sp.]|nr:PEP-CTERM sorting domain-containing protein [Methylotenera sp.]
FASWGTSATSYSGSSSLINDAGIGLTTLNKSDNGFFNLHRIDLAGLLNITNVQVTFIGTKTDNSFVTQTFTGPTASTSYTFDGFTDLSKVEWLQDNNFLNLHQFDNIILSSAVVSAVPEPAVAWLFGSGILGLLGLRRKALA